MTVKELLQQLKEIQTNCDRQITHLDIMDKEIGKGIYGSVKSFNEAKYLWLGKKMQIVELIGLIEYQLEMDNEDTDLEDTPDIWDMGINEYGNE